MPRYYFDFDDGESSFVDIDGVECLSVDAAEAEAIAAPWDVVRAGPPTDNSHQVTMSVRDGAGRHVLKATFTFSMAISN